MHTLLTNRLHQLSVLSYYVRSRGYKERRAQGNLKLTPREHSPKHICNNDVYYFCSESIHFIHNGCSNLAWTKWPLVLSSFRCAEELCHTVTTPLCHEAVSAPVSIYLMASVCLYHHCHLINGIAARPPPSCAGGLNLNTSHVLLTHLEFYFNHL